ncbi:hypothetical protein SEA_PAULODIABOLI_286 [Microbacterium phage PauloDiaboli]|nr:hypothetical protein SEA_PAULODIABOLI_286 [Microbacterium phage PauloDiaboli]QWY84093.1 hypothetical protein SEA_A3WALLY_286 [Microbacterium phage A3Wally]
MGFEFLLLLPFGTGIYFGVREYLSYRAMSKRGPQMPKVLKSNRPPGQIQPALDPRQQLAIEIGRRELEQPDQERWDREFHLTLSATGEPRKNVIPGDIIVEKSLNGRVAVEYHEDDQYDMDRCDCVDCRRHRARLDNRFRRLLG